MQPSTDLLESIPLTEAVLPQEEGLTSSSGVIPVVVQEVIVTGSSSTGISYWDMRRTAPTDNFRPDYGGSGSPVGSILSFDVTDAPTNNAEMSLAIQYWLFVAANLISALDPTVEHSALIYLNAQGEVTIGDIGSYGPDWGGFELNGIPDGSKIVAMIHSHPQPDATGLGRFPGSADWSAFDYYEGLSAHKDTFIQVIIHDGERYMYKDGDRDVNSTGPVLRSPFIHRIGSHNSQIEPDYVASDDQQTLQDDLSMVASGDVSVFSVSEIDLGAAIA